MIQDPIDAAAAIRAALARAVDPVVLLLALLGALGSVGVTLLLHEAGLRPVPGQLGPTYAATIGTSACTLVVTSITFAAMTLRVIARERGDASSFGASLAGGLRVLVVVYVTQAITSIATSIGLAMCIAPGVYVALALATTATIATTERIGPLAAIERARALVEGRLGSVAAVIVPIWIANVLALCVAVAIAGIVMPTPGLVIRYVAVVRDVANLETPAMIVAIIASRTVTTALYAATTAVVYLRLRAHEDPSEAEKIARVFA